MFYLIIIQISPKFYGIVSVEGSFVKGDTPHCPLVKFKQYIGIGKVNLCLNRTTIRAHDKGFVLLDIKSDNVFSESGHIGN